MRNRFKQVSSCRGRIGSGEDGRDDRDPVGPGLNNLRHAGCVDAPDSENGQRADLPRLLQDSRHHLIYTAPLENSQSGFDTNRYNFQMIVAESDKKATATTYYFFVEII